MEEDGCGMGGGLSFDDIGSDGASGGDTVGGREVLDSEETFDGARGPTGSTGWAVFRFVRDRARGSYLGWLTQSFERSMDTVSSKGCLV